MPSVVREELVVAADLQRMGQTTGGERLHLEWQFRVVLVDMIAARRSLHEGQGLVTSIRDPVDPPTHLPLDWRVGGI